MEAAEALAEIMHHSAFAYPGGTLYYHRVAFRFEKGLEYVIGGRFETLGFNYWRLVGMISQIRERY